MPLAEGSEPHPATGPVAPPCGPAGADPETPVADALDQARPVAEDVEMLEPSADPEAPEADALDQARVVPIDPEERDRPG